MKVKLFAPENVTASALQISRVWPDNHLRFGSAVMFDVTGRTYFDLVRYAAEDMHLLFKIND